MFLEIKTNPFSDSLAVMDRICGVMKVMKFYIAEGADLTCLKSIFSPKQTNGSQSARKAVNVIDYSTQYYACPYI